MDILWIKPMGINLSFQRNLRESENRNIILLKLEG